jgi:hypothetical protein
MINSSTESPELGKHAWSGQCCPTENTQHWDAGATFSVGIFEWIQPKSMKTGKCKRGPVKVRIKGLCSEADKVYALADKIAGQLNAGTYAGPKNVWCLPG